MLHIVLGVLDDVVEAVVTPCPCLCCRRHCFVPVDNTVSDASFQQVASVGRS